MTTTISQTGYSTVRTVDCKWIVYHNGIKIGEVNTDIAAIKICIDHEAKR